MLKGIRGYFMLNYDHFWAIADNVMNRLMTLSVPREKTLDGNMFTEFDKKHTFNSEILYHVDYILTKQRLDDEKTMISLDTARKTAKAKQGYKTTPEGEHWNANCSRLANGIMHAKYTNRLREVKRRIINTMQYVELSLNAHAVPTQSDKNGVSIDFTNMLLEIGRAHV